MKPAQPETNDQPKQPKQLTEVEALARVTKVLNQLSPESRKKVLSFLAE